MTRSERPSISTKDFGASFKGFLDKVASQAPAEEAYFVARLREHLGVEPSTLEIVEESFEPSEQPNLQLAIDALLSEEGCSAELLGVASEYRGLTGLSLASLVIPGRGGLMGGSPPTRGPVQYENLSLGRDQVLACVQSGLYLIRRKNDRIVLLVDGTRSNPLSRKLGVEVMVQSRDVADQLLATLRNSMRERSVYRGRVLTVHSNRVEGALQIDFNPPSTVGREQIILPDGLLDQIERQTLRFTQHAETLRAAGRHLRRGVLFHGLPGTGKTLTAMYLISQMPDRTVLLLNARDQSAIVRTCALARLLEPSTIVLEDIDLVAEERTRRDIGCNPFLFELLNQMDGFADDADVLFLLTTNRPDMLEPALASRPGRVDLAIEFPLPDAPCRQRLFELYGRGLTMRLSGLEQLVKRTEGVSPAFIRELLRKATLIAADSGGELAVEDRHMDEALEELLFHGSKLTRSLLGVGKDAGALATKERPVV